MLHPFPRSHIGGSRQLRKLLKGCTDFPHVLITDNLGSDVAAKQEVIT